MQKEHMFTLALAIFGVAGTFGAALLPDYLKSTYSPRMISVVFVACLAISLICLFAAITVAIWPLDTRDLLNSLGPGGGGGSATVSGDYSGAEGGTGGQGGAGAGGTGGDVKVTGKHSHASGGAGGNARQTDIPPRRPSPLLVPSLALFLVAIALAFGALEIKTRLNVLGPGGRGGSARVVGDYSGGEGGAGGKGGNGPGGAGGDVEVRGSNSFARGGDGGNAGQPDGRGGRRTISQGERLNLPTAMWPFGNGGAGTNAPEYDRRLHILTEIREEYLRTFPNDVVFVRAGIDQVPISWVNKRLEERRENWRVMGMTDEGGYQMPPLDLSR